MRSGLSAAAKLRMREGEGTGLLRSDWLDAVFIHYRVRPAALQGGVPFELDVREGWAYVSFVAFTLARLRLNVRLPGVSVLTKPIATHPLLNLRTYVRRGAETGIYFLAEWLPNPLSAVLGPRVFGLPYRLGRLRYRNEDPATAAGEVAARGGGALRYESHTPPGAAACACGAGTEDEFLLERYTAYTRMRGRARRFRVWHEPWPVCAADVAVADDTIVRGTGGWWRCAERCGAHWSAGVRGVWMGRPVRLALGGGLEVAA